MHASWWRPPRSRRSPLPGPAALRLLCLAPRASPSCARHPRGCTDSLAHVPPAQRAAVTTSSAHAGVGAWPGVREANVKAQGQPSEAETGRGLRGEQSAWQGQGRAGEGKRVCGPAPSCAMTVVLQRRRTRPACLRTGSSRMQREKTPRRAGHTHRACAAARPPRRILPHAPRAMEAPPAHLPAPAWLQLPLRPGFRDGEP